MGFFRPIAPGGAGGGANFTALTNATIRDNELIFNRNNNAAPIVVSLSDFASLVKDNNFTGANNFQEITIGGIQYDNRDFGNVGTDTGYRYFGVRNQSSGLFYQGYVENLRFYLHSLGNTQYIDNVSVWAITKGQNIATDIVARQVVTNQRFDIKPRGANAQLEYIEIPIEEAFADDTYFVTYLPRTGGNNFQAINQIDMALRSEYVNMGNAPVPGGGVQNENNRAFCAYSEIRGRISVKEELLKKPAGGTAGVSDVTYDPVTKELVVTTNGVTARHSLSDLIDVTDVSYDPATKELVVTNNAGVNRHDLSTLSDVTEVDYNDVAKELVVTRNGAITRHNLSTIADVTEVTYDQQAKELVVTRNNVPNRISLENLVDVTDVTYNPVNKQLSVTNKGATVNHDLSTIADVTEVRYDEAAKELVVTRNGAENRLDLKNLVDVTDVRYNEVDKKLIVEKQGVPVEFQLDGLITKINNIDPQNGNIQLELEIANDNLVLKANGRNIQTVALNGYVKRDELTTVGGAGNQDKVPQLGVNGKLDNAMIPDLQITNITGLQQALDERVKTVNQELPDGAGNIELKAEKVPYNGQTSQLAATNVQDAIDELKKDVDLIDTADVHIVANKQELDGLLAQGTLKKGDIVYVINSDGVVDNTDTDVNNGTNPVAMIFDDNAGGNQLRLFSKLTTPVNIIASNVQFDSQNVDGVNSQDVQGAIEEVNNTARNSYHRSEYDPATGKLKLIKHDGTEHEYDLATRNPEGLVNAELAGNIITFTRENGQRFPLDLKDLNLQGLINQVSLADTVLQLTKVDGSILDVNLKPILVANKVDFDDVSIQAKDVHAAILEVNQKFDGVVREVNGKQPLPNGSVTVTSSDIEYDNQASQLASDNVKDAIDELVTKLNSKAENITNTGTELQLLGNNAQVLGSVQLMTQQEVQNIIDQFV